MDPNGYKGITVQVLQLNFVFVDATQLLLIHGLLSWAFRDFRTWEDLENVTLRESSLRINIICLEFQALSVFSVEGCMGLYADRQHSWTYREIQSVTHESVVHDGWVWGSTPPSSHPTGLSFGP